MIDILRKRRSVRKFQNRPVETEKIEIIMEALLRSPTSRNLMSWDFILITEGSVLDKLSRAKPHGSEFLKGAVLGVVILGNESKSDVWIEDCSIAGIIVQLTAESLGLGSCWAQIRNRHHDEKELSEEYIGKIFNLPENIRVEAIIGIGYPAESRKAVRKEDLPYDRIHTNTF